MSNLKISVITVSFNAADTIEETILSVLNQTYDNLEYIIIDGGSTDGTVDIIKKYADKLDYWISEPDKGIYDAMNKGIRVATGEYVNFMNAGDRFFNNSVISDIFTSNSYAESVIYGCWITQFMDGFRAYFPSQDPSVLKDRNPINHQSAFTERSVLQKYKFNLEYPRFADYDLFRRMYKDHYSFRYINKFIAIYDVYGISSVKSKSCFNELQTITENTTSDIKYFIWKFNHSWRRFIPRVFKKAINRLFRKENISHPLSYFKQL